MKANEYKTSIQYEADWEINSDGYYPYCTRCGEEPKSGCMTAFCPNCGARMRNRYKEYEERGKFHK